MDNTYREVDMTNKEVLIKNISYGIDTYPSDIGGYSVLVLAFYIVAFYNYDIANGDYKNVL